MMDSSLTILRLTVIHTEIIILIIIIITLIITLIITNDNMLDMNRYIVRPTEGTDTLHPDFLDFLSAFLLFYLLSFHHPFVL